MKKHKDVILIKGCHKYVFRLISGTLEEVANVFSELAVSPNFVGLDYFDWTMIINQAKLAWFTNKPLIFMIDEI